MQTSKIFNLIGKIICYILFAFGIVFGLLIVIKSSVLQNDVALQDKLVLPCVFMSYIAVGIAILIAIFLPMFFVKQSKKQVRTTLFIILGAIILFGICWIIPDAKLSEEFMSNPDLNVNDTISKWVGVGCYYAYFMFAFSIIAIIYAGIVGLIKRS